MDDADLAKSWSFFDYVARKRGAAGQRWLRAAGKHSLERGTFIERWRESAATILEVEPAQAFRSLEASWRDYASTAQAPARGKRKR